MLVQLTSKEGGAIDSLNHGLVTIPEVEYSAHTHRAYMVSKLWTDVANGANRILRCNIPKSYAEPHLIISVNGEGAWHLKIFENIMAHGGTMEIARDMFRCNPVDLRNVVYSDGSVDSYGTKIYECLVGGGFGTISGGNSILSNLHFCGGKKYLIRMGNASGAAADCSINVICLDHTI